MYCPSCGKEVLSDVKYCPSCGKEVGKPSPSKPTHPTLAVFLIGLVLLGVHIFLIGASASSSSRQDIAGINAIFGFIYLFLFFVFLATLLRKPTAKATPEVKNVPLEKMGDQKKAHSHLSKWVIGIVLLLIVPAAFILLYSGVINPVTATVFVAIALVVFAAFLWRFVKNHREKLSHVIHRIKETLIYARKHPKITFFSAIAGVVVILFIYSLFLQANYKGLEESLPGLQDALAETATAKLMGDAILSGNWASGMWMGKIAETAKSTSENITKLSVSRLLSDYKASAITWNTNIASAAVNTAMWKDLSEPPAFMLSLNDNKVNKYIESSFQKIASLKQAGDLAIKRQDRKAMYYVAGELLVQEHWINGILHANNPGILSWKSIIPTTFAAGQWSTGTTTRKMMCNSRNTASYCKANANPVDIVNNILRAAMTYAAAKPDGEKEWNQVTSAEALQLPAPQGQYVDAPGGVYNGEPNLPPQLSPAEKAFVDECKGKGGTTANTGGVMDRIPTTEAGLRCNYPQGGNNCWDYLTSGSSRRYMGGNPGCPEHNLLPPPPPPMPTPRPARSTENPPPQPPQTTSHPQSPSNPPPASASWDGTYRLQIGGSCNFGNLGSYGGVSFDQVTVRNNRVYDRWGASAPIDSSGHAQISNTISVSGYSISYRATLNFYNSGGARVRGNFDIPALSGMCSITLSGNR